MLYRVYHQTPQQKFEHFSILTYDGQDREHLYFRLPTGRVRSFPKGRIKHWEHARLTDEHGTVNRKSTRREGYQRNGGYYDTHQPPE